MGRQKILMLEHDQDDRYLTQESITEIGRQVHIDFVRNSEEFWAYLHARYGDKNSYPSLILLSQKAAPQSALSILKELKSNTHYSYIPVVVLGNISYPDITREYYAAGASSFIQKPATNKDTQNKISNFIDYWFDTVELE